MPRPTESGVHPLLLRAAFSGPPAWRRCSHTGAGGARWHQAGLSYAFPCRSRKTPQGAGLPQGVQLGSVVNVPPPSHGCPPGRRESSSQVQRERGWPALHLSGRPGVARRPPSPGRPEERSQCGGGQSAAAGEGTARGPGSRACGGGPAGWRNGFSRLGARPALLTQS